MSKIAELFRESPFEPLRHHMEKVMECVGHVHPMYELVRNKDFAGLTELTRTVFKTEHEADLIKDEIRQTIPKSFFLPVYRGDLLGYLALQDSMADDVEDMAFLLTIKQLECPPELADRLTEYVEAVIAVARQADEVSSELTELVSSGFSGAHVEQVVNMVTAVEQAEWKSDRRHYELCKALFALEDQMRSTDVLLWFRVLAVLAALADHAEKAADRVRRMLAK